MITSLHNPRIKDTVRLRERKHRDATGLMLIDGAREIGRALKGGLNITQAFYCEELLHTAEAHESLDLLRQATSNTWPVTPQVFEKLAYGDRTDGVIATAAMPHRRLRDIYLPTDALVLVIEGLEKPGNLGAVIRTADAVRASAVIAASPKAELYNPNVIRASLGLVFTMPVAAAAAEEVLSWLRAQRLNVVAARVDGAVDYSLADFTSGTAIVLGAEDTGLSEVWRGDEIRAVRLPMQGVGDSLNVSVTAAVLCYEALRQRTSAR